MKKSIFIGSVLIIIFLAAFLGLSINYSNQIIYPRKEFPKNILNEWGLKGDNPKDYHLDYEEIVLLTYDGLPLKGWYIKAQDSSLDKAIILVHGYGTNRIKMLKYAPFLHKAGFNILLFDLRTHGESAGKFCSLGYYEKEDIKTATDFLYNRGITKIGILAESLGAVISILAMAKDKRIKAGVFDSPFCDLRLQIIYYGRVLRNLPELIIDFAIFITEKRLHYKFNLISPIKVIHEISPRPIFFIHGEDDRIVKVYNSEALFKESGYPKYIWITKESRHAYSFLRYQNEYENKVMDFFAKSLD